MQKASVTGARVARHGGEQRLAPVTHATGRRSDEGGAAEMETSPCSRSTGMDQVPAGAGQRRGNVGLVQVSRARPTSRWKPSASRSAFGTFSQGDSPGTWQTSIVRSFHRLRAARAPARPATRSTGGTPSGWPVTEHADAERSGDRGSPANGQEVGERRRDRPRSDHERCAGLSSPGVAIPTRRAPTPRRGGRGSRLRRPRRRKRFAARRTRKVGREKRTSSEPAFQSQPAPGGARHLVEGDGRQDHGCRWQRCRTPKPTGWNDGR